MVVITNILGFNLNIYNILYILLQGGKFLQGGVNGHG
jgi:hypothetical protein